ATAAAAPQALAFVERPSSAGTEMAPVPGEPLTHELMDDVLAAYGAQTSIRLATEIHEILYRTADGAAGWVTLVADSAYRALAHSAGFEADRLGPSILVDHDNGTVLLGAEAGWSAWPVEPQVSMPAVVFSDWYVMADADL